MLWIGYWWSEPYYQHQNMFERRYQTFKRTVNRLMDRTGSPLETWFLCMCHMAYIFNRVSDPSLNFRQPHLVATGRTMDISPILAFSWMEPVYYKQHDTAFPSDSPESLGYFVGFSEHVGHLMTFKIWNKDTNKVLDRSVVCSALHLDTPNFRSDSIPSTDYINWLCTQFSPTTDPSSSHKVPADYGERFTGRPPDHIFSLDEDDAILNSPDYGEPQYLDEAYDGTQTNLPKDKTAPEDVPYRDLDGNPYLDARGRPTMISGMHPESSQGTSFFMRNDDGTKLRARIIKEDARLKKSKQARKDFII